MATEVRVRVRVNTRGFDEDFESGLRMCAYLVVYFVFTHFLRCWRLLEGIAPPGVCVFSFFFLKAKPIEDYEGHAGSHRRPGASD